MRRYVLTSLHLLALLGLPSPSSAETIAFTGARILPVAREPIASGVLVVREGQIVAVGPADSTAVPPDARRVDVAGKTIIPGLVDTHSHVGGIGGADDSGPIQPDVRILDSINVRNPGFRRAVAGGLTTLNIMPGSGHLLGGRTIYVKLRGGTSIEDLYIRDVDGKPAGGVKMANGTNSRAAPPFPGTRGKSAALMRAAFIKAQEYRDKIARAAGDPEKMPPRDLGLETLVEILERKRVVHHHTHRHDDILTVLRLAKEFNFRVVLHHVSDGWKVANEIAAAGAPCSVIVIDSPGGKLEAVDLDFKTSAVLEKAGVLTAIHTDDWITDSRLFLRSGALAVRAGMSRDGALKALTISGAKMLDLDARVGSLEPGKDADFVVLSGDPFSVYTQVLETWVEGKKVFDRSDPKDHLYAVGGFGAGLEGEPDRGCCDREDDER
ncbi:MAG TPA: amidohydrolase family protein [Planctomycetota bacterium]|jgi:imidazolonepropionase-like amidohydrolase|nr:amidohydrolase family protein [Planctomycetota bacterium]